MRECDLLNCETVTDAYREHHQQKRHMEVFILSYCPCVSYIMQTCVGRRKSSEMSQEMSLQTMVL
jgi:hypothetical protein